MGKMKILKPGFFTTIQDMGRKKFMGLGVSLSGSMDKFSYLVSNYLVGNNDICASLEITIMGPQILFENNELISICGGDISPYINELEAPLWSAISVKSGDVLSFRGVKNGARAYLSFSGGLKIDRVLDSFSTNTKAVFGGFNGRKLNTNDILETLGEDKVIRNHRGNKLPKGYIPLYNNHQEVNVILGPQDDFFSKDEINKFFSQSYEITQMCDRMGIRLSGDRLNHLKTSNIISDGNNIGCIQIPGDGLPIILMNDCGTTGGYPKIGAIIYSDLDKVAQLKAGDHLNFKLTNLMDAHKNYKKHMENINELKKLLIDFNPISYYYNVKIDNTLYNVSIKEI